MYIEQLDKTRLLITLEHEDLDVFDLEPYSISMENKETKALFKQLLTLAAIKAGIQIKDKVLSVETMPYDFGCFLLVTIKPKRNRKMYRVKKDISYLLVELENAMSLLDCLKNLQIKNFSNYNCNLYRYNEKYYLLFFSKAIFPPYLSLILSEFGTILPCDSVTTSRIEELYECLHEIDTIKYIGNKI